jgi:hypothetical protein
MGALRTSSGGIKIGSAGFGKHGAKIGSVRQIVHDGDTIEARMIDEFGVRFLGIDSAEISFPLPGKTTFVSIGNAKWAEFFTSGQWREGLAAKLSPTLLAHLDQKIGNGVGVAENHAFHAQNAQTTLETAIQTDLNLSGKTREEFLFFMAFAHEFLDGSGRLLCYLHPDKSIFPADRLPDAASYNERQLRSGAAAPHFIWPNVQPFIKVRPFESSNASPTNFWRLMRSQGAKLNAARALVKSAREQGVGVFQPGNELILTPFELRYICRRSAPDRFVIDLSQPGSDQLLAADRYFEVPNPEDRLFVSKEYLEVFQLFGWKI